MRIRKHLLQKRTIEIIVYIAKSKLGLSPEYRLLHHQSIPLKYIEHLIVKLTILITILDFNKSGSGYMIHKKSLS